MKLHEAIQLVLAKHNRPLSVGEIAHEVNSLQLYERADGKLIPVSQIISRINAYEKLFKKEYDGKFTLVDFSISMHELVKRLTLKLSNHLSRSEISITIPTLLFYLFLSSSSKYSEILEDTALEFPYLESFHPRGLVTGAFSKFGNHLNESGWDTFVEGALNNIPQDLLSDCLNILSTYFINKNQIDTGIFGRFFNSILSAENRNLRDSAEFTTPDTLNKFIAGLINPQNNSILFDPFAGVCGTLVECCINNHDLKLQIIAQDIAETVSFLGKMNMLVSGINYQTYIVSNSLRDNNSLAPSNLHFADLIVTVPPISTGEFSPNNFHRKFGSKSNNFDNSSDPISAIINYLKPDGKAYVVVPDSVLFSYPFRTLRETLVNENLIYAVISLPQGMFMPFASINCSIIIIDKSKGNNQAINFVNLSNLSGNELLNNVIKHKQFVYGNTSTYPYNSIVDTSITGYRIQKPEYLLNTNRYIVKRDYTYNGNKVVRLEHFLEELKPSNSFNVNVLQNSFNKTTIPFVRISDLSTNSREASIDLNKINLVSFAKLPKNHFIIDTPSILFAQKGKNLKATLYNSKEPIAINKNVLAFSIRLWTVDPIVLIHELYKDYVQEQFDALRLGTVIPFIRKSDLLKIAIHDEICKGLIPGKDYSEHEGEIEFHEPNSNKHQQISFVDSLTDFSNFNKELFLIKHLKHSYSQIVDAVNSDVLNIKLFMQQKEINKQFISMNDRISNRPGAPTVANVFGRIEYSQKTAGELFQTIQTIISTSVEKLQMDVVNLKEFLLNQIKYLTEECIDIKIEVFCNVKKSNLHVKMSKPHFSELFRNLIINACKHGFVDSTRPKYVFFDIEQDEDPTYLTINYLNSGVPFPDNFTFDDFKSFGKKYDHYNGSGLGGNLIALIVEKHNGVLSYHPETDSFPHPIQNVTIPIGVHFKIKIPKYD